MLFKQTLVNYATENLNPIAAMRAVAKADELEQDKTLVFLLARWQDAADELRRVSELRLWDVLNDNIEPDEDAVEWYSNDVDFYADNEGDASSVVRDVLYEVYGI